MRSGCLGYACSAVIRLDHLIAGVDEQIANDLTVVECILYDQYPLGHAASRFSSIRNGRLNINVEPRPGSETIPIVPP